MTYRTKYQTTGFLSDGSGNSPDVVEIPQGVVCTPAGDGAFFAEDWRQWGGADFAAGTMKNHDATYRGIRVQGCNVEFVKG